MGNMNKAPLLPMSGEKAFMPVFELGAEQAIFIIEHTFLYKEWLTEKLWSIRLGYLADVFLKMNKVSQLLQGKQDSICYHW